MKQPFKLTSPFTPEGDQPTAIASILEAFQQGKKQHVLLGVTGSGKTFTMAHVIATMQKPALIIAPNKTLAAQLYTEFKSLFPEDHVGLFMSYYDYYQPEAYLPSSDTYIAKDSAINEDIDKMRHESTRYLVEEPNTIIVASVSCIYGLGSPTSYAKMMLSLKAPMVMEREELLRRLIDIQYSRNDRILERGCFRVRGDVIDILPAHDKEFGIRVRFFGDEIESLHKLCVADGKEVHPISEVCLFPNSHYITPRSDRKEILTEIRHDLGLRLRELRALHKEKEAIRLEQRTFEDLELFEQLGYCPGIENYSRYLTGQAPGEPPACLLDYFPDSFLTILDESHITVPQIRGMYRGDRARKENLVAYGFRLPAALDNRPLTFEEFMARTDQVLHVSATPGAYEQEVEGSFSEQVIRPTGLIDPKIEIHPAHNQIQDVLLESQRAIAAGGRVLLTTLTKKMSEELTEFYREQGLRVRYLHSDIDTLERTQLLRELRMGTFDVLIGINLLREGLDLPEVTLVAILDADKEGFLRSKTSIIQTVGRAARNKDSRVILYADEITNSIRQAVEETERRRYIQLAHNAEHGITPKSIQKDIPKDLKVIYGLASEETITTAPLIDATQLAQMGIHTQKDLDKLIRKKTKLMQGAALAMDFEQAAKLRNEVGQLRGIQLEKKP